MTHGEMKHRNGTVYKYRMTGCGEALQILTNDEQLLNTIHIENPGWLTQEDLDLAEFVIDGMEITAELLADAEKRKQLPKDEINEEIEIKLEPLLQSA